MQLELLIPLLSLASLAVALPSSSPSPRPIWSRVVTSASSASSSSPIVWSSVDTSKPSSTSPLVWSKVDTSKPSPTSTSSYSPLVWSRVDTVKPTTTSTPQWSRVTRSRPASSSSSSSSTLSSISTTTTSSPVSSPTSNCPKGIPYNRSQLTACYQGQFFNWTSIATYLNYRVAGAGPLNNTKLTNGTGYYSGSPLDCPHAEEVVESSENYFILRIAASDELAAQFGGIENLCGKKLFINEPLSGSSIMYLNTPTLAVITRICSPEYCPGVSLGIGSDWFEPPRFRSLPTLLPKMFLGFPRTIHEVKNNMVAWMDWNNDPANLSWY
ncbi:hypothetical protein JCM3765_001300 [Sporobolomyces pararoseus]